MRKLMQIHGIMIVIHGAINISYFLSVLLFFDIFIA